MDTSVTIIGIFITLLVAIPLFFAMRSNTISKNKIKAVQNKISQENNMTFDIMETLNKKIILFDAKNKGFILIDTNKNEEIVNFIDLKTVQSCNLISTKNGTTVSRIEIEFKHKNDKPATLIALYKIENDQINQVCLYEDQKLAEKWNGILQESISK